MDPAQTEERARRANDIGRAPTDPANRKTITLLPPPYDENFSDKGVVKVIGHNCMDGWPTPVVTWGAAPEAFKARAWSDFTARFTWHPSIDAKVKEIYAKKCAERTKGMFNTARTTAIKDAEKLHPGQGREHMHNFPPWWCSNREIWVQMCQKWREDKWAKRSQVASANRASGSAPGERAHATYRGGTKPQVQYMKEKEAQSQSEGGPGPRWTEVYSSLRSHIPSADTASEQYDQMMLQKYPDASSRPDFDHDVWVTASGGVKKGYVKGLGFKRSRASDFTSCTSVSVGDSTATSAAPLSEQSAEAMVRAICTDENFMDKLTDALLSRMTTDQIGAHLAGRAQAQSSANTQPPPPPPPPAPAPGRDRN